MLLWQSAGVLGSVYFTDVEASIWCFHQAVFMAAYLHSVLDLAPEEINCGIFWHSQTARWDLWYKGVHSNVHLSPRLHSPLHCSILSLFACSILPIVSTLSLFINHPEYARLPTILRRSTLTQQSLR